MMDTLDFPHLENVKHVIEKQLNTKMHQCIAGSKSTGRICYGIGLETDLGKLFVKMIDKSSASALFTGEFRSLQLIESTNTLRVPKPIKVTAAEDDFPPVLVMEYLDMKPLQSAHGTQLGEQLARMHLHNESQKVRHQHQESSVHNDQDDHRLEWTGHFGFYTSTYYGNILQVNPWTSDWQIFFTRHRLHFQVQMVEQQFGDREVSELWSVLEHKIPSCFKDVDITPALLHGDFHGKNVAAVNDTSVCFDPSSFYGHHEFDISIAEMFGGFPPNFWEAYHRIIPKQPGFGKRKLLYDLYNYLNHWNHFGPIGYLNWRQKSLDLMKKIINNGK